MKEVAAVILGLALPIALIVGAYYAWGRQETAPTPPVTPTPVVETPKDTPVETAPQPQRRVPEPPKFDPTKPPEQSRSNQGRAAPGEPPYPTHAVVKDYPGDVGDMYLSVPADPVGQNEEFEVDLVMNGGDAVIAATTMLVHFDPLALEFKTVTGSLTAGSSGPLATNMKAPGVLVISDINAPRRPQGDESPYNTAMTADAHVYTLTFKAVGDKGSKTFLGGGSTTFHDPGEGGRGPAPIGTGDFPRTAATNKAEIEIR
jgi:hypothetical protein